MSDWLFNWACDPSILALAPLAKDLYTISKETNILNIIVPATWTVYVPMAERNVFEYRLYYSPDVQ